MLPWFSDILNITLPEETLTSFVPWLDSPFTKFLMVSYSQTRNVTSPLSLRC